MDGPDNTDGPDDSDWSNYLDEPDDPDGPDGLEGSSESWRLDRRARPGRRALLDHRVSKCIMNSKYN